VESAALSVNSNPTPMPGSNSNDIDSKLIINDVAQNIELISFSCD